MSLVSFKSFVLISLLSIASAVPSLGLSSDLQAKSVHESNNTNGAYLGNVAGFVQSGSVGTFLCVAATIVAPVVSGPTNTIAIAAIGIDGFTSSPFLRAGITATVTDGDQVTYEAWHQWSPGPLVYLPNPGISTSDQIAISVQLISTTEGIISYQNLNKNLWNVQVAANGPALAMADAEWITIANSSTIPTSGNITFQLLQAVAFGNYTTRVVEIETSDSKVLTSVDVVDNSIFNNSMTISFL